MNVVSYEVKDRTGIITLNRPDKRNALSFEMVSELMAAFHAAENDEAVKVVILKAEGDIFCAGADLATLQKLQNFSFEENLDDSRHLGNLFYLIYTLKKVVIAQVQGHALAGGFGLATVCDFIFAVPEAKFGYTEVKIGFVPAIVMVFLLRKIGEQKARQLLLSGELLSAEAVHAASIVSYITSRAELDEAVSRFAQNLIKSNSAQSMELTKKMIGEVQSMPLLDALDFAARMNAQARSTPDCKKGIEAFLTKKDLSW